MIINLYFLYEITNNEKHLIFFRIFFSIMRILMLQRFDLSSVSCTRRILCQAEELLRRGHEVYLTDFPNSHRQNTIPAIQTLSNLGAFVFPLKRKAAQIFFNYRNLYNNVPKPDIIHLWKSYPDASLAAWRLSRIWNVPLHYDWDDWERGIAQELAESWLAGWLAWRWDRFIPSLADTMTTASEYLRKKTVSYGFPENRIWDAPVGADLERFSPRPKKQELIERWNLRQPLLVYSGQLEVASYVEQAIDVLKEVRKEFDTAKLLVLGGGRKLPYFKTFASEQKVENHVVFTDYIPANDVPDYLALADVALAPFAKNNVTRAKSPLKIAEYLAMGLPIVSSNVGEAPKMTVGAGACAPCGDIRQMAEKTIWILRHPGIQQSMCTAGRKLAESTYNWKTHTDALEEAYQCAIGKHR